MIIKVIIHVCVGFRYLCSLVETILIYQHFKKPSTDPPGPKQELLDFWMDFLVEATKKDVSSVRFPVRNTHTHTHTKICMHTPNIVPKCLSLL